MMDYLACLVPGNLDLGYLLFIGIFGDLEADGILQSSCERRRSHGRLGWIAPPPSGRKAGLWF